MSNVDLVEGRSVSLFSSDDISVEVRLLLLLPGRASSTAMTSSPVAAGAEGSL